MNRNLTIYIVLLIRLVYRINVYIDASGPKPINWTPTYVIKDKIPLGLYVFDKEARSYLKTGSIKI